MAPFSQVGCKAALVHAACYEKFMDPCQSDLLVFSLTLLESRMLQTPCRREFMIEVASVSAAFTWGASLSAWSG